MIILLLSSVFIMLASLAGVITIWRKAGKFVENNLGLLISFSAGVFLVITYELVNETLEHAESLKAGLFWIFTGAIGVWLLFKLLPVLHHHDPKDGVCDHIIPVGKIDARRILIGDGIHNIGDGILLSAAFFTNFTLGLIATLSIFTHEVIQEISEFFVLRQAGYSTKKALKINFLVSSTILIGAIGGYFLLETFEILEVPLLGLSAGAFLIVVTQDLMPHSLKGAQESFSHLIKHLVWFFVGIAIIASIGFLTKDYHSHEKNHADHSHADHDHEEEIINLISLNYFENQIESL